MIEAITGIFSGSFYLGECSALAGKVVRYDCLEYSKKLSFYDMRFHIDDIFYTYFEVFTGSLYHSTLVLHPLSKATGTTALQV